MPLGMEVGLGPGPPHPKGQRPPIFGPCHTAGWINMTLARDVDLGPDHSVLDGDPDPLPETESGTAAAPFSGT